MKMKLSITKLNIRMLLSKFYLVKSKMILAFAVILLIPSLSIGWVSYTTAKSKVNDQMKQAASEYVNMLNRTIDQNITAIMKDVDFLSQDIATGSAGSQKSGEVSKVQEKLDRYMQLHPELELAYVGTDKGEVLYSPSSTKLPSGYDPRERPWFKKAMENKEKVIITEAYISSTTNNVVATIAKVTSDGHGVVAVLLNLKSLSDVVGGVKIGNQGYVYISDANRAYLFHPTQKTGAKPSASPTVERLFSSDSGEQEYINTLDGKAKVMVFATNKVTGWKLAGTWYKDEVTQEAATIFKKTVLVIVIALLAGTVIVFVLVRAISTPLLKLTDMSRKISEGDLRFSVDIKSKDEFGELGASFNRMVDSLKSILVEVSESSNQLAASSEQLSASAEQTSKATEHIASAAQEMADGANQQVHQVEESTQTIQEVSTKIQQIAANSKNVAETTTKAAEKSSEGGKAIQTAAGQMGSISGSVDGLAQVITHLANTSLEISQITEAITQIAQQTNLLSLNAAIEAARAGEHGRGFAVVAGEVKKLAEQSSQSAEHISRLIHAIQSEIEKAQESMQSATKEVSVGMEVVQTAGSLFAEIECFVNDVNTQVREVSVASQQISEGTKQVVLAIEGIAGVAQTAASGTENVSAASEEQLASMQEISSSSAALTHMAGELQGLVEKFKL